MFGHRSLRVKGSSNFDKLTAVACVILEMREGSGWGDSPDHYEFPARYLRPIEDAQAQGPTIAIIYEPRRQGGRQAFVAWTLLESKPIRATASGVWRIAFSGGLRSFDSPVPFVVNGQPVEYRLRTIERSRWGSALQGKSIRPISDENAIEILSCGCSEASRFRIYQRPSETTAPRRRIERLVSTIDRDVRFRDAVLESFEFKCAVTGFGAIKGPASRLFGVLDAAHIRPVSREGPDELENGIAMTPTVHRMFDAGLFTLGLISDGLRIECSPQLHTSLVRGTDFALLPITTGRVIALPGGANPQRVRQYLDFHRSQIWLRHAG
jgi:putative restriction endonuclease